MSILKIKDWLLFKTGAQFVPVSKNTIEEILSVIRLSDGMNFELYKEFKYVNNGDSVAKIISFKTDFKQVIVEIQSSNLYPYFIVAEINDLKFRHSNGILEMYSYVDRSVRLKPRRRVVAKKHKDENA